MLLGKAIAELAGGQLTRLEAGRRIADITVPASHRADEGFAWFIACTANDQSVRAPVRPELVNVVWA